MPELRWTLLILGGLFILGLALWEFRRQRQAPRQSGGLTSGDRVAPTIESGASAGGARSGADGGLGGGGAFGAASGPGGAGGFGPAVGGGADTSFGTGMRAGGGFADSGRGYREPIITLPELHPADSRGEPRLTARRDPPVVEVDDAAFSRLHVEGETGARDPEVAHDEDTIAMSMDLDAVEAHDSAPESGTLREPGTRGEPGAGREPDSPREPGTRRDPSDPSALATPNFAAPANAVSTSPEAAARGTDQAPPSDAVGFATDADDATPESPQESAAEAAGAPTTGPVVDWPSEESRKIVALRLVSAPAARFQGRAVRQALAAEGFVLGKFDIFHKPGPDDRAVLSAASLTKPGTFAMNTIDAQRFGGISLFAVLPGPLSPQETFDELLSTARNLNTRLQGALQDERGEPLTPMRSASIRQSLSEGNGTSSPGDGAGSQSETRQ
jgi:FtsZ-interacting cell division protein ZipA